MMHLPGMWPSRVCSCLHKRVHVNPLQEIPNMYQASSASVGSIVFVLQHLLFAERIFESQVSASEMHRV